MNVLFIKPYWPYPYSMGEYTYNRIWPPLCLASYAAILEQLGHRVKILDAHAERIVPKKITGFISNPDKIFITSSTLDKWQCPNLDISYFLMTVAEIKKHYYGDIYILGYHGTVDPEEILKSTGVKAIIRGEPEDAIVEICDNRDLTQVAGVTYNNGTQFISTAGRKPFNLQTLPPPAYHLLNIDNYFYEILGRNFSLFEISRGCNYSCNFCNKIMYGEKMKAKSSQQVRNELSIAIEKFEIKNGYFIDLNFLSYPALVEEICDFLIMKKYNFKWTCQTRPDSLNRGILKKMKQAGCKIVHLGIESGSLEELEKLNKGFSPEKIKEALKICRELKIMTVGFFLFGLPGETAERRIKNYRLIKKMDIDFISLHKIHYYGNQISFPNTCTGKNIDRFIRSAYLNYYLRPSSFLKINPFLVFKAARLLWGRNHTLA